MTGLAYLAGLNGVLSKEAACPIVWDAFPWGASAKTSSEEVCAGLVTTLYQKGFRLVDTTDQLSTIDELLQFWTGKLDPKIVENKSRLDGILAKLKSNGYTIAPPAKAAPAAPAPRPQVKQEPSMPLFRDSPPAGTSAPAVRPGAPDPQRQRQAPPPQAVGSGNEILDNILGVVAGVVQVKQAKVQAKAASKAERERLRREAESGSQKQPDLLTYGLIGGGVLLVIGLAAFLVLRKKGPS